MSAIRRGNISSLPISIANESTSLEKSEYPEKPPDGPTISNPGPTLLKQVTVAVKLVVNPKGSKDIMTKITRMHII